MALNPSRTTLSRLKCLASVLREAHKRLQTELGTFTCQDAVYAFTIRLGLIMNKPYDSEKDTWVETLAAQTLSYLDEFSGMWQLQDGTTVQFTDEGWAFKHSGAESVEALVHGVQSKYALYAITIALKTDQENGKTVACLISTLLAPAVRDALLFCEHFIKEIEAAPFR